MKHLFQFLLLAFFAATSIVLPSCGDDKKTDPAPPPPTTGALNGQITPANAITTVTATSTTTPATTATATPNASGAYTFAPLAAGTYTLSFTPATGYGAPNNLTGLVVTASNSTTAPPVTVTMSSTGGGATLAYTINGTATTANLVAANVVFGSLFIQGSSNISGGSQTVTLSLDQLPTGPRTYTFGGAGSTSEIAVLEIAGTSLTEWNTLASGGTGIVAITSVSTNPRRASGTFSAVAQPRAGSGATGTRTLTTGTFSNLAF